MKKQHLLLLIIIVLVTWSCQDAKWRQLYNGKDLTGWEQVGPGEFF